MNTDAQAILSSLAGTLECAPDELAGRSVAVIGAGGTGRTAVAALAAVGCDVTVYNRTLPRAQELAQAFNANGHRVRATPLEELADAKADIFLQTTSVGMHPNVEASPFDDALPAMSPETVVMDVIYTPGKTRLLEQAEAAGARIINGEEMFLNQAAAQFKAWTDQEAPLAAMRRAFRSGLEAAAAGS